MTSGSSNCSTAPIESRATATANAIPYLDGRFPHYFPDVQIASQRTCWSIIPSSNLMDDDLGMNATLLKRFIELFLFVGDVTLGNERSQWIGVRKNGPVPLDVQPAS